jgi:hypothetical protein
MTADRFGNVRAQVGVEAEMDKNEGKEYVSSSLVVDDILGDVITDIQED